MQAGIFCSCSRSERMQCYLIKTGIAAIGFDVDRKSTSPKMKMQLSVSSMLYSIQHAIRNVLNRDTFTKE